MANQTQEWVDGPGASKYLKWARVKLNNLKTLLKDLRLPQLTKHFKLPDATISIRAADMNSFIRIQGSTPGEYILRAVFQRISPSLNLVPYLSADVFSLSFTGAKITTFPGYTPYSSFSKLPYKRSSTTFTSANSATAGLGYFKNERFTGFSNSLPTPVGAFRHAYTDGPTGLSASKLLTVHQGPAIRVGSTNAMLSFSGGTAIGSVTFGASKDGRAVLVDVQPAPEPPSGSAPVLRRFLLGVDFAETPQVVSTEVSAAASGVERQIVNFPAVATPAPGNSVSWQNANTSYRYTDYPLTRSVSVSGELITTILRDKSQYSGGESVNDFTYSVGANVTVPLPYPGAATEVPGSFSSSYSLSFENSTGIKTVIFPNGYEKEIITGDLRQILNRSWIYTVAFQRIPANPPEPEHDNPYYIYSETPHVISGSGRLTFGGGSMINVLYSDPAVPILVYEHNYHDAVYITVQPNYTLNLTPKREVGVIVGESHRVLFTETGSSFVYETGGTDLPDGAMVPAGADAVGFSLPQSATIINTTVPTTTTSPIALFRKKLRFNHFPSVATSHRYVIVAKNTKDWIVAVNKVRDLDNNTISTFDVYSGRAGDVKAAYIAWLIAELTAKLPALTDPTDISNVTNAVTDIAADPSLFELNLSNERLGSYI